MRAVIQRVSKAAVAVEGSVVGEIGAGLMVLLGVEVGDSEKDLNYVVNKTAGLRVFEDSEGLMNLDLKSVGGSVLAISQFTLLGDVRKGKRPSFISAARPEDAQQFYEQFCAGLRSLGVEVEQGVFQADMQVSLTNDGPVTILLDSRKLL